MIKETEDRIREEKIKRLTGQPIYPLLVKMSIPSMIGMIVSTVYSMTDTYFVGKLNNVDLTASVGIVFSFVSVIQAIGFWFGYGSGNYISRCLGKKDIKSAEKMAATGVLMAIITGFLIMLIGPMLEEKYGSKRLFYMMLITAFIGGLANVLVTSSGLLGASGIAFMMIVLCSCTSVESGYLPLTMIIVVILYIGKETVSGVTVQDNISQLSHILGGICGVVFGMYYNQHGIDKTS